MQKKSGTLLVSGYARVIANDTLDLLDISSSFMQVFGEEKDDTENNRLGDIVGAVNAGKIRKELLKKLDFVLMDIVIKPKKTEISAEERYISIQFEDTKEIIEDGSMVYRIIATDTSSYSKIQKEYEHASSELDHLYIAAVKATAYIMADDDFSIYSANDNFYKMLGYSRKDYTEKLQDKAARTVYLPDRENLVKEFRSSKKGSGVFSKDVRIIKKDGTLLWVNIKVVNLSSKDRKKPSYFCVFTDVDNIKKTQIEYNKQSWFMELISESIAGGTKITYDDKKRSFAYVGKDLLNFLGYSEDDFLRTTNGNMHDMIFNEDVDEVMDIMDQWFIDGNYYEIEYRIRKKDGSLVWVMDKGNKITNENGEKVCISLIVDIDNTRKLIDKLEYSNNEMKKLQNSIPGCFGKVVLQKDFMYVISGNEQFYDILGVDTSEHKHKYMVSYESINISEQIVHETVLTVQDSFYHELHDIRTDKWLMINGTNSGEFYEEKYPIYFVTIIDISTQKESVYQVQVQQEKYKIISELSEDIVFEYDCKTDIMVFADKFKQVFGREYIICGVREMLKDKQFNRDKIFIDFSNMFESIDCGNERYQGEFCLPVHGDEEKWFSVTATGMRNENGFTFKIIGALRDIDKQKREQQKLFDQSRVDSMTQLLNKMATEEEITKKIDELQSESYGVLMMIDIDNFKNVNDSQGHLVGDSVITKIAGKLKRTFRSEDVIGRVGGDEFQVYMSNVLDSKIAYEKAEHLCSFIREMFDGTELEGKITVSIGAVCVDKPMKYKEMYQKADIALYNAKENGKDRYEVFGQTSKVERILQTKQTITQESVNINNNLIINTIDILFSRKRMEDNINNVFEYVGYAFSIDKIVIYEKSNDKSVINTRFEWSNGKKHHEGREKQSIPVDNFVVLTGHGSQEVFYCGDINDLPDKQRIYYAQRGVAAILQCNIVFEGRVIGYMNFIEEGIKRVWNQQEISTLVVVAKLVSEFVIRGRNGVVLQKENKEKKFAMAMRESCEYLLDINVMTGNYDLYLPCKDGLNSYLNRGNYDDWLVEDIIQYVSPEFSNQFLDTFLMPTMMRRFASGTTDITMDYIRDRDGESTWHRRTAVMINNDDGTRSIVIYVNNIDEYKKREEERAYIEQQILRHHLAIQNSYEEILEIELNSCRAKVIFKKSEKNSGIDCDGNIFTNFEVYMDTNVHPDDKLIFMEFYKYGSIMNFYENSDEDSISVEYRRSDINGDYAWVCATIAKMIDNDKHDKIILLMIKMISDYKMKEEKKILGISKYMLEKSKEDLQYRAEYDLLTGIHNMQTFYEETAEMIKNNKDKNYAIIRIDIDKFKLINDLYGFDEGNNVLKYVARQLVENMDKERDTYCRMNADVFCLCMEYNIIDDILQRIAIITDKIREYDINYNISPYFGICVVEDLKVDITVQCDWANLAMKTVKGNRLINYAMYDNKLRKSLLDERKFESEMERALSLEQFEMYLQPQYDIATSKIVAAEALVRWNYPDEGVLAPYRFIPIFEKNGFIIKLDEFIWEQACKTLHKWIESGKEPIPLSVNVSRIHIYDSNLCDKLIELTNKYSIPHHLLELELTESLYFDDAETLNRILKNLRNLGFVIAMDDFGSAYSSLNTLENIPIDILKLDRELLQKADSSEQGQTIVKYIIAMAKQLKLKVVAEGVENVEQAMLLLKSSCYIAQGFYYSKPIPLEKFESLAYNKNTVRKIDRKIKDLLNKKKDFINIVMELQDKKVNQEFINTVATFDEIDRLRQYFVNVIDKYRELILDNNNLVVEIDAMDKRLKRYDNEEMEYIMFPDKKFDNYDAFCRFMCDRCHPEDVAILKEMLKVDIEQNALDEGLKNVSIAVRIDVDNNEYRKVIFTFIPIGNESGELKNIIVCLKDVTKTADDMTLGDK